MPSGEQETLFLSARLGDYRRKLVARLTGGPAEARAEEAAWAVLTGAERARLRGPVRS